jgi:TonB family protein
MPFRCVAQRAAFLATAVSFLVLGSAVAQDQSGARTTGAAYSGDLHTLAARILKRAGAAKCHRGHCTILVANFIGPSGSTSRLGIQLADSLSAELAAQAHGIQIVDRSRLREFLDRERIPSNLLKDRDAARWLASQLKADVVLTGTIEQLGDRWNLLTELLNLSDKGIGPQEATWLTIADPQSSLESLEPYEEEGPAASPSVAKGTTPSRVGVNGVGVPECIYCPPPLYTDTAQKLKFNGTVVLQVTVSEEGRAEDISVVKGLPFSMTEQAIKAVRGWEFKPATDGKEPVAVRVPIEITFRLY